MTSLPKYTITYFNARWLAEPIRYLLRYVGENFEDVRISWEEWEKSPEENKKKYPYGKLPFFTERDTNGEIVVELSQSFTIIRYLARKYELVGTTNVEQAKCEEYADCVKDMLKQLELMWTAEEKQKTEIATNLLEKSFPRYFSVIEKDLAEQQQKNTKVGDPDEFFPIVGTTITWVDFILSHYTEIFEIFMKQNPCGNEAAATLLRNYPSIKAHQKGVFSLDKIKEWIEERPVTPF